MQHTTGWELNSHQSGDITRDYLFFVQNLTAACFIPLILSGACAIDSEVRRQSLAQNLILAERLILSVHCVLRATRPPKPHLPPPFFDAENSQTPINQLESRSKFLVAQSWKYPRKTQFFPCTFSEIRLMLLA
jgi:hypothetical protein